MKNFILHQHPIACYFGIVAILMISLSIAFYWNDNGPNEDIDPRPLFIILVPLFWPLTIPYLIVMSILSYFKLFGLGQ